MPLNSVLKQIDQLKVEFEALKPLKKEDEERLWKKFRLDWNYNSNHIEGNTLTYEETDLLLRFGKTTGDHTIREYEEMQAHDVCIKMVQEHAKDKERGLSEQFIRFLNETLLVKPFWADAKTPDKQPTRRKIIPGEYKKHPNSVILQNGDVFEYSSPQEVPILMGELVASYNKAIEDNVHPIEIAAMLHYKFVRIHPFDDGNGRVARLLMNYVLLANGYQPAIIKTEQKKEYLNALNKTDVLNAEVNTINNTEPFAEYIANQLLWSYDISIRAAKGDSIIEEGDLKKKIKNLNRILEQKKEIKSKLNNFSRDYLLKTTIKLLIEKINENIETINSHFFSSKLRILFYQNATQPIEHLTFNNIFNTSKLSAFSFDSWPHRAEIFKILISYKFVEFKKNGEHIFDINASLQFDLSTYKYTLSIPMLPEQSSFSLEKYLDEVLTEEEMALVIEVFGNNIIKEIENKIA